MVDVASTVTSITVTATQRDSNASVRINGQPTNSLSIPLNGNGSTSVVTIVVIAQNGSQKTYTVTVNRQTGGGNNKLSDLTVSPGTLDPSFNGNTTNYTLEVASTVTSVTVSATKADPNAVISGSVSAGAGTAMGQATIPLGGPGTTTPVLITITASNGNSKTYRVNVVKAEVASNNTLSALGVTPGALNPVFTPATTSYTVEVGRKVDSIHVTASTADSNAGMTIDGQGTNSGQTRSIVLDPPGSSTGIEITVTAPNGSSKTYSVTVNRAAKGNEDDGRDKRGK
jgi:hypothetical protein